MNNKIFKFSKLALATMAIFLSAQAGAISTRIGNVVECRQEHNNGNGLYIKREGCFNDGTYGGATRCLFKAYFTAEGNKDNKSVIESLRENSAFPSNADKFTNLSVDDMQDVKFQGYSYNNDIYSHFRFYPVDNNGHFGLQVRSSTGESHNVYKQVYFNYTYNCGYVP